MAEKYKNAWIKEVNENVLWICQLPRSGGTLLLRLLDSHPELHCYPTVFGFANDGRIWPDENIIIKTNNVLKDIFEYMNLEKFHLKGIKKQSSNMDQEIYPVYFNVRWFREIFQLFCKGSTSRDYFNAFFTALFNSWRNYQCLYGEKKYICGHMTLRKPELYRKNYENFKLVYPEGKMIFIIRKPDDWLASALNLKKSTPFSDNPFEIMEYYKIIVSQAVDLAKMNSLIVLRFEELILEPTRTLKYLTKVLDIEWNELLLTPTFNGAPFYQNSSFNIKRKSAVDPEVIGRGKYLKKNILKAIDGISQELYNQIVSYSYL